MTADDACNLWASGRTVRAPSHRVGHGATLPHRTSQLRDTQVRQPGHAAIVGHGRRNASAQALAERGPAGSGDATGCAGPDAGPRGSATIVPAPAAMLERGAGRQRRNSITRAAHPETGRPGATRHPHRREPARRGNSVPPDPDSRTRARCAAPRPARRPAVSRIQRLRLRRGA